jgi:hypothetical protein
MAVRSLIAFAVVIALQSLAGCDMPAKSVDAHDDRSAWRKVESEARDARLRRQVEAGTFGLAQLFPGGMPVDPRDLKPLPRPSAVPIPAIPMRVARSSASETPVQLAFAVTAGHSGGCVYKPVMSDADMDACR